MRLRRGPSQLVVHRQRLAKDLNQALAVFVFGVVGIETKGFAKLLQRAGQRVLIGQHHRVDDLFSGDFAEAVGREHLPVKVHAVVHDNPRIRISEKPFPHAFQIRRHPRIAHAIPNLRRRIVFRVAPKNDLGIFGVARRAYPREILSAEGFRVGINQVHVFPFNAKGSSLGRTAYSREALSLMLKNQWDREEANRSQLSCAGTRAAFGIEGGGTAATRPITPTLPVSRSEALPHDPCSSALMGEMKTLWQGPFRSTSPLRRPYHQASRNHRRWRSARRRRVRLP